MVRQDVLNFIHRFTDDGRNQGVIDTFTHGCCYWFASILADRFYDHDDYHCDIEIMYDEVMNHFGCRIDGVVYDVTGDVTKDYDWETWDIFMDRDYRLWERVLRDCIKF